MMDNLEKIAEDIRLDMDARDKAREIVLPLCREAIRFCSQSIRAIHRRQMESAEELLDKARGLIQRATETVVSYPDIGSGMLRDAQKEFAEGNITYAIVSGRELPEPSELSVGGTAYLNGLGEAVGEIRRYLLDSMRRGDLSRGEELLGVMDDIYSVLVTIDYPDAITGGLRRTTDMVRGILERTRSDLTLSIQQKSLENRLDSFSRE
jgi:translin